jgi:NhaP-type Na+/H+ or K+/H+ antiporter
LISDPVIISISLIRRAQKTSRRIFEVLAFMAETFVFVYLGLAIFTFDQARQLSLWSFVLFNVFILDSVKCS